MKKLLSILLILCILLSVFVPVSAAPSVTVTYNGAEYASGSSIHYTGSTVTIQVSSSASSFTLYINNSPVVGTSYTFTNPAGPQYIKVFDGSVYSPEVIINMYNDVIIDPNATYSYVSFKAAIDQVISTKISPPIEVDYNDGADSNQVNSLFDRLVQEGKINAAAGGTYKISGYLFVRVFNDSSELMGEYNCLTRQKVPNTGPGFDDLLEYNWDYGTESGLIARGKWEANHTYTPLIQPEPEFEIWYDGGNKTDQSVQIDELPYYVDIHDRSKNVTSRNWYIKTPAHTDWTLFSTEQNPSDIAIWAEGTTQFKLETGSKSVTHSITATLKPAATPAPGAPPQPGIGASSNYVKMGDSYTIVDQSTFSSPATKIVKWKVKLEKKLSGTSSFVEEIPETTITSPATFFRSYTQTQEGIFRYHVTYVEDDKGQYTTKDKYVDVTVYNGATPGPTPTPTPTPANYKVKITGNSTTEAGKWVTFKLLDTAGGPTVYSMWDVNGADQVRMGSVTLDSSTIDGEGATVAAVFENPGIYEVQANGLDANNNLAIAAPFTITVTAAKPSTGLHIPEICYPKRITDTGAAKNTVTWSYNISSDDNYSSSSLQVYKKVSGLWEKIFDGIVGPRQYILEGNEGEEFKFVVKVKSSRGVWSDEDTEYATIFYGDPNLSVITNSRVYINNDNAILIQDFNDPAYGGDPLLFYFFPTVYNEWKVKNSEGNAVLTGTGKLPTTIHIDPEKFTSSATYTLEQIASSGSKTESYTATFLVIGVPAPVIGMSAIYEYIESEGPTNIVITQPQNPGDPVINTTFNNSNCSYKVVDEEGNVVIPETPGIYTYYSFKRVLGYQDSTTEDKHYTLIQKARNSVGGVAVANIALTVKRTPIPTVILSANDTLIDENLNFGISIEDILAPTTLATPINVLETFFTYVNANWTIEKIDSLGNAVKTIKTGTGLCKNIVLSTASGFEENGNYRLVQYAKNRLGGQGKGTTTFVVKPAPAPVVSLSILERDSDPATISNQIFSTESLLFTSTITDGNFPIISSSWQVKNSADTVVMNGTGGISGLVKMSLEVGSYTVTQRAINSKGKEGLASVSFTVKDPLEPSVGITSMPYLDAIDSTNNVVYITDSITFNSEVNDYNRSEEHPEGFPLTSSWAVKDTSENVVNELKATEVANNKVVNITSGYFVQGQEYIFRQFTQNAVLTAKQSMKELRFRIGNKKPTVSIETIQGDGIEPLYTNEGIKFKVSSSDSDGKISALSFKIDGQDYKSNLSLRFEKETINGLNTSEAIAELEYIGAGDGTFKFVAIATDNFGAMAQTEILVQIVKPNLTADIKIKDEDLIQKKEYRFIEYYFTDSKSNSPYPLQMESSRVEYQSATGKWAVLSDSNGYQDENIRVHFPSWPKKDVMQVYYKKADTYTMYLKVADTRGNTSDFAHKDIVIVPDQAPSTDFTLLTPQHRITEDYINNNAGVSSVVVSTNLGKGFFKYKDMMLSPDGDPLAYKIIAFTYDEEMNGVNDDPVYSVTVVQDSVGADSNAEVVIPMNADTTVKVKDINNYKLTFLTGIDGLGYYWFKSMTKESITQLPPMDSPLYSEIKAMEKSSMSAYLQSSIENIAPTVEFDVNTTQQINLIIQYDTTPTVEQEQKLNEIINQLKLKGVNVNVIRKYNQY